MNYIKLQQDILKAKFDEDTRGRRSPFLYGLYENSVAIIVNGCYIVFVPKHCFYLDLKKVFPDNVPVKLDTMLKRIYEAEPVEDTKSIRIVTDKERKVRVFAGPKDQIWLADDTFKYFGKDVTEYRGTDKKGPVYLYEYEVLVGIILPVNHH